jgi:hypothetical protein
VLEWLLLLLTNTMIRQHALALILASIGTGAVVMLIGFSGLLSNRRQRDRSGSSSSRPLSHLCAGLVLGCAVGALALVTAVAVRNRWSDGGVHSANLIMYSGWTIFFAAILLFGWSGLHARGNLADRLFGPGLSSTRARDLMIWSLLCWLPEILFLAFFAPRAPTAIETYTQQTDFWFVLLGIPLLLPALGWCDARLRREQRHALWMRIAVTACACVALGLAIGVQSKWVPQWRLYVPLLVFSRVCGNNHAHHLRRTALGRSRKGAQWPADEPHHQIEDIHTAGASAGCIRLDSRVLQQINDFLVCRWHDATIDSVGDRDHSLYQLGAGVSGALSMAMGCTLRLAFEVARNSLTPDIAPMCRLCAIRRGRRADSRTSQTLPGPTARQI